MGASECQEPQEPRCRGRRSQQSQQGRQGGPSSSEESWQRVDTDSDTNPLPFIFSEPVGPTLALPTSATPFDSFSQVIDESIVHSLVEETNK